MNTPKIAISLLLLSAILFPTNITTQAKPKHQIGFLKGVTPGGEAGGCDYWIAGGKENTVILSENYITKSATINIDGQNISLKQIQRKNTNRNGNRIAVDFKYKSQNWQIQGHLTDATTAKDKKGAAARDRGTMNITNNDGWQANRQIECAYDIGG
jgi:hypothetical protein